MNPVFGILCVLVLGGVAESKTLLFHPKENKLCPDKQGSCPEETTCCQLPSQKYGCCPLPDAVCCSDHAHCCPSGYTCDVVQHVCTGGNGDVIGWFKKTEAIPENHRVESVVCPDQTSQCEDGQTCCQLSTGQWGCCPLPQAVCCNDHEHCCPNGYTCDVAEQKCNKENGESIAWSRKVEAISKKLGNVVCPDQTSQCEDGQTCCQLSSGEWGCCPLPQAVCCNDHEHCCPNGYTCDVSEQKCNKENGESIAWSGKVDATPIPLRVKAVICPDQSSQCQDGETCCQLSSGQWGCCPLPQAVCCNDHEHCCPNGYTCDVPEQKCNKENGESVAWSRKVEATPVKQRSEDVICPDQSSKCATGQTCCQLPSGLWGCCPLPQAVCCNDHEHCCPNGYTCDVPEQRCNKANGKSIAWLKKIEATPIPKILENVICPDQTSQCEDGQTCCKLSSGQWGCCPLSEAVCCSDNVHCCPNGYTCDASEQKCSKENGESVAWSKKVEAISKKLGSVVCPDQTSQCDDGQTCCQLSSGQWGCCPLPEAVCCNDHEHCCPNGYTCDVAEQKCNKENGESIAWSRKVEAISARLGNVVCPDQTSQCDDGQTCCQLSSGQWGCCPLPKAVCCDDHEHCCPNGYTCDVAEETCNKGNGESIPWSRKVKATPIVKKPEAVICPDQSSQCQDGQTCCQLTSGQWGCCPLPEAVCCNDHEHCCPSGYTCDVPEQKCNKQNGKSISWSRKVEATPIERVNGEHAKVGQKCGDGSSCSDQYTCCLISPTDYGCCPLPQATCCNDYTHCCPHGYQCDLPRESCIQDGGHEIPWTVKVPSRPAAPRAQQGLCFDEESRCQDGSTCCGGRQTNGRRRCCPYENAVCCSDGLHCCPADTTCNAASMMCESNVINMAISYRLLEKTVGVGFLSAAKNDITCPDQTSKCPADSTCCQTQAGFYGCCPFKEATCCADKLHCCPSGSKCDVEHSSCVFNGSGAALPWDNFGHRRAKTVV